jgi:HPt (histidine-containing phosphotransfer) domain-containing protein
MDDVRAPWHFDRAAALDRLDDDEELLQEIIEQFLSDAPASLEAIEDAIRQEDGPALRDAAHALKGAAGYLAADDLCVAAQQLEGFGRSGQADAARAAWPRFTALAGQVLTALRATLPGA